jgi:hypothetical protein
VEPPTLRPLPLCGPPRCRRGAFLWRRGLGKPGESCGKLCSGVKKRAQAGVAVDDWASAGKPVERPWSAGESCAHPGRDGQRSASPCTGGEKACRGVGEAGTFGEVCGRLKTAKPLAPRALRVSARAKQTPRLSHALSSPAPCQDSDAFRASTAGAATRPANRRPRRRAVTAWPRRPLLHHPRPARQK